ncbi:zwei Ig domain protein zig-8-like [Gigantopelta aegis]|uniref:zwei Ig domain protein zig-8-like n=1 Tax=Gigantopelta aegis TaxID=1735272 RepID=UPI001B88972F|nr:zwei Ig domain protein zig-8-like [Gigantopelta aegis]
MLWDCELSAVQYLRVGLLLAVHLLMMAALQAYDLGSDGGGVPYFNLRPTNLTFHRGDTAILYCSIEHLGTKTVIWRRASDPNPLSIGNLIYVPDSRYSVKHVKEEHEWNLVIKNVNPKDEGIYECQISSRAKLIQHVLVRVNDLNPTVKKAIFVSGTKFVEKGDPIHVVCNASGSDDPPSDLVWFKDGIKITPDAHQKITIDKFKFHPTKTLVSVLDLKHSTMHDAGTYVCRSSNSDITSIKVHVLNAGTQNVKRTSTTDEGKSSQTSTYADCCTSTLLLCLFLHTLHWTFQSHLL